MDTTYNVINTAQVIMLCAMSHFVHLLFSVCNSYNDIDIVNILQQIKIPHTEECFHTQVDVTLYCT